MNQEVKSIVIKSADAPGLRVFLKRLHAPYAFAFATALLISGCSSVPKGAATAASGQSVSAPELAQKASGSAYVSASPLSDQLTTATITDPSLNNMVAATMTIPAGWKLEGIEMMPPCTAAPSPVYQAYSPDGLMQLRQEPIPGWHWSAKGAAAHRQTGKENLGPPAGCSIPRPSCACSLKTRASA